MAINCRQSSMSDAAVPTTHLFHFFLDFFPPFLSERGSSSAIFMRCRLHERTTSRLQLHPVSLTAPLCPLCRVSMSGRSLARAQVTAVLQVQTVRLACLVLQRLLSRGVMLRGGIP